MANSQGPRPPARRPGGGSQPERAQAMGARAAAAATAAAAFYRGWRTGRSPNDPVDAERQRQAQKYHAAMSVYRSRLASLKARYVAGSAAVIGGAAVAASSLDGMPSEAPLAVLGGSAVIVGAWNAVRSRKELKALTEPRTPPAIVAPPLALPPGSPGAQAAAHVTSLRVHIIELLPTLDHLHAEAADQVRAVDAATAPGLNALVERIRSMQHIIAQMPGTPAAQSARITIDALSIRLKEGASAYQDLLGAVIALSSAPAIEGPPAVRLRPAIDDMRAYAAGLERAAQTW